MSLSIRKVLPRLPLDGMLDITYRCNNTCRHCWLWLSPRARERREELTFPEIRRIVDEARQMGCQAWNISGGEPMLRPDFSEIFDYITRKAVSYSLNTNGTLITQQIARLLTRKGRKMVALYGATADVHDSVTRNPGSFDAMMQGIAYLKEAGAGFEVQIIPLKSNYHQYSEMLSLAKSLSPDYRVGASWLFLSACGSTARNREISRQRLDPAEVLVLDTPDLGSEFINGLGAEAVGDETAAVGTAGAEPACGRLAQGDDRIFAACIAARRNFHIDPYGQMSFCYFAKEPALRFNLRQGTFRQAWDVFLPTVAETIHGGPEYLENCGTCDLRKDCRWCGVYSYLEHRRSSAKIDYLCQVARQTRRYKENWKLTHLRYYQIAGITIQVAADFPITDKTFASKFDAFSVEGPGTDNIALRLTSPIPPMSELRLGKEIYHRPPWAIYRQVNGWVYLGIQSDETGDGPHGLSVFNPDHTRGTIYRRKDAFEKGGLESLTTFPSDQVLLARVLADRQGCYVHSSAICINGQGLLFIGHSEAGKSTMLKMLRDEGEILCDDRNIVRRWPEGFKVHGTWSHGELPDVSPAGAPLRAILFLEKADDNALIPVTDKMERVSRVLSHVIRPLVDMEWWEKILALAEQIADEVPAYRLRFDKSGHVREVLQTLWNA